MYTCPEQKLLYISKLIRFVTLSIILFALEGIFFYFAISDYQQEKDITQWLGYIAIPIALIINFPKYNSKKINLIDILNNQNKKIENLQSSLSSLEIEKEILTDSGSGEEEDNF